jgi:hypothetical protein
MKHLVTCEERRQNTTANSGPCFQHLYAPPDAQSVHTIRGALSSGKDLWVFVGHVHHHLVRAVRSTRRTESRATRLGFAGGGSCVFWLAPSPDSCWCAVERRAPDCLVTAATSASPFCDRPCRFRRRHDNEVASLRQPHCVKPLPLNSIEIHVAPQHRSPWMSGSELTMTTLQQLTRRMPCARLSRCRSRCSVRGLLTRL